MDDRTLVLLTVDPATLQVEERLRYQRPCSVPSMLILAFATDHTILVQDGNEVVRVDTETGARTVLFPRAQGAK